MKEKKDLSTEQMTALLDNAPVAIYVTAADDWELLYVNRKAAEMLHGEDFRPGVKCYQTVGYDAPCPFCQVKNMVGDELLVREFKRPSTGRVYEISGKVIDWAGRRAHIEYIKDVTEEKREEERSRTLQETLQDTFSGIPSGLCVYRFDEKKIRPLFHNPAFYQVMGYSEEHIRSVERDTEFLGVHPEDAEELKQKIKKTVEENGVVRHTYRLWNDKKGEYSWIRLEGAAKLQGDGSKLLYAVYTDVSEQMRLERELTQTNAKMQDIVNAIPGGVAIYRVSKIFETVYFSDGVPELSGYTVEEYWELAKGDAAEMTYKEDTAMVVAKLKEAIANHTVADFEFRKMHRSGHIVWVHIQAKQIGEDGGLPLLQCVFHNISKLKETQLELDHLVNSIPGGIASFKVEAGKFIPAFVSDGVTALSGYSKDEYSMMGSVYETDRSRVTAAVNSALATGEVLDVSYRIRHKNGNVVWIHLNGRRMGPLSDVMGFYAVFTGMSAETRLFQSIANETADGIYVIDKESYELLYANESKKMFSGGPHLAGQKCYATLHGKSAPCEFCTLKTHEPDGEEHEIKIGGDCFYTARFIETDWNGIPAYVQYIRDATEEFRTRKEKERLEMYFQTVIKNLPGGISVIRCESDGGMTPEFISDGFAALVGMTKEEAEELYKTDIFAGVYPEDAEANREKLQRYLQDGKGHLELVARMKKGSGGYIWVKSTLSLLQSKDGVRRLYSVYTDVSKTVREKETLRKHYEDVLLQHYRIPDPDILILGHCDISNNRILEIDDHTHSDLLKTFGSVREEFFSGIASLIVDEKEREAFLGAYLNAPALAAFQRKETEKIVNCFIKLPKEEKGRYVQFKVNLVESPDTGDITGILTVTDVTERTVFDRIMHQLSVTSYDYIVDLNLDKDAFSVLVCNKNAHCVPSERGCHSLRVSEMTRDAVVPKDRARYANALEPEEIRRRLKKEGSYTFSYSLADEEGNIRTKNMTVSAIDLRLGRVCLVCTDITDSVREQQGLLNMIAYTFELACFIDADTERLIMYTREAILKNLPPYVVENYGRQIESFTRHYGTTDDETAKEQLSLQAMLRRLDAEPGGYDFVFPYRSQTEIRYKQINVLWGDQNRKTVCVVRADVTDMLLAERRSKATLEKALAAAEEANRAKSDFLSNMSHDIRTPMNAIMGMTTLAVAHLDERERVADCLQKISVSSRHLLSLINDVLDMSRMDRSKIALNLVELSLNDVLGQLSDIMGPQARSCGIDFRIRRENLRGEVFYGDSLRLNQILINLLSNAIKFTPEHGRVEFVAQEIAAAQAGRVRYRFTVRDTGIGMPEEFISELFVPFARSKSAGNVEGTGLGLSITKGLIDLMGGKISVESKVGKGSTFVVELEFDRAKEIRKAPLPAEGTGKADDRIFQGRLFLVAEDNAINAEILCELLAMHGAKSVVRKDGAQTVREFEKMPPATYDAILMDIQMPEMNGYEATRRIRSLNRFDAGTIPIIAMTANAFTEDIQNALNVGMTAHVAKPIDMEILRSTLEKVLP